MALLIHLIRTRILAMSSDPRLHLLLAPGGKTCRGIFAVFHIHTSLIASGRLENLECAERDRAAERLVEAGSKSLQYGLQVVFN
jgi:hypothetical protein